MHKMHCDPRALLSSSTSHAYHDRRGRCRVDNSEGMVELKEGDMESSRKHLDIGTALQPHMQSHRLSQIEISSSMLMCWARRSDDLYSVGSAWCLRDMRAA